MIVDENSQSINVREGSSFVEEGRTNVVHRLLVIEDCLQREKKWVIHGCIESVMSILRNVSDVTIQDLSNLIDSCILSVFLPEWLLNMRYSINANTVKVKLLYSIFDPVKQSLSYPLVILVQIWQIGEAAVLNLVLVIPVFNLAFNMIVRRFVKRSNFVVISINISNMIGNYIKHHPNSH